MNDHELSIHQLRDVYQTGLYHSVLIPFNVFDPSVDLMIDKLVKENEEDAKRRRDWIKENGYEKYEKLDLFDIEEGSREWDIHMEINIHEANGNIFIREQELLALFDMKIIHLYKSFEIRLKKLLNEGYPNVSTRDFYKWESITMFLKSKNIKLKEIEGYTEVVQLKDLNNSLKHTDQFSDRLISFIPEFNGIQKTHGRYFVNYNHLLEFYNRIKDFPQKFLEELTSKIYSELYEFNDSKIHTMAKDIVLRMEKEDAFKYIEKIRAAYDDYQEEESQD
jgi:hypothetical protein